MIYDYSKLKGRIKEKYETQENLAKHLEISHISLSKKLNNKTEFKQAEIISIMELLEIKESELTLYFFSTKV